MVTDSFEQNVLLYLYSTAPQVLGAILALLGLFHIYRLDHSNDEVLKIAKWILDKYYNSDNKSVYAQIKNNNTPYESFRKHILELEKGMEKENFTQMYLQFGTIIRLQLSFKHELPPESSTELVNLARMADRGMIIIDSSQYSKVLTADLFKVNGLILVFFIASFVALPLFIKNQWSYWLSLSVGALFAIYSLFTMVGYVINAVLERYQVSILRPFGAGFTSILQDERFKKKSNRE